MGNRPGKRERALFKSASLNKSTRPQPANGATRNENRTNENKTSAPPR